MCLNEHASNLTELGRLTDAREAAIEAGAVFRRLSPSAKAKHGSSYARACTNLGWVTFLLADPETGLKAMQAAAQAFRELAVSDPGQHEKELFTVMTNLVTILSALKRTDDALAAEREATRLYRSLASVVGELEPFLAQARTNLVAVLVKAGDPADAVAASTDAQEVIRVLPERQRLALELGLVKPLWSLGQRLLTARRAEDALRVTTDLTEILRRQAHVAPDKYERALADAQVNQTAAAVLAGKWETALGATNSAIAILREHPEKSNVLANCRESRAFILKKLGRSG
jgi:tetratricopeptide (TPR) repeat protein